MREALLIFWHARLNMPGITNDYLRGYAHALRDTNLITEQDERELLQRVCERVNPY